MKCHNLKFVGTFNTIENAEKVIPHHKGLATAVYESLNQRQVCSIVVTTTVMKQIVTNMQNVEDIDIELRIASCK